MVANNEFEVRTSFWDLLRADALANTQRNDALAIFTALFTHPGYATVARYRVANWLCRWGVFGYVLALLFWRLNIFLTACHIHFYSSIGPGLELPHPVGIVVGQGVRMGSNVCIYQNSTIGAKMGAYPVIGNDVTFYPCSATIGPIQIGDRCIIGANAVVLASAPADSILVGIPARNLAEHRT